MEATAGVTRLMFKDAFWGRELTCHAGYDTVIQRLQGGRQMCKDVEELLKMRALSEEKYGKELVTIASKAGGHTEIGTLRASFEQLKSQIGTSGHFHIHLSDILKEEVKMIETFRERQKEQRKKFQSIMDKVQRKKVFLYKKTMESKRNYELRSREAEEAEQEVERMNAALKNPVKIHQRAKQSRQMATDAEMMYFSNAVQLEGACQDWEKAHRSTCEVFQQLEEDRIETLRRALWDHCNHFSMQCVKDDVFYEEARKALERCDITTDNNSFIEKNGTGLRPPEHILFESCHRAEASAHGDGRAHCEERGSDRMRRCADSFPASPGDISVDGLQNSHSALTAIDEPGPSESSSVENSDGGSAPPPAPRDAASLATAPPVDAYTVLYDYSAQDDDELSIGRGDVVRLLEEREDGWWAVEKSGRTGLVPGSFLAKNVCIWENITHTHTY